MIPLSIIITIIIIILNILHGVCKLMTSSGQYMSAKALSRPLTFLLMLFL